MRLVDYPMDCCGLVEAKWITSGVEATGVLIEDFGGREYKSNYSTDEDWDNHLKQIEEHQLKYCRNCALLTLASYQNDAIKAVERNGWKVIHEFYNPNSCFRVRIYQKTLWNSSDEYRQAVKAGYKKPDFGGPNSYAYAHNPWEEDEHRVWAEDNGYVQNEEVI